MLALPLALIAFCVAVGFFYASFGLVTLLSDLAWGSRLWPLELVVGLLAACLVHRWSSGLIAVGASHTDRGQRAIWRLAQRKGLWLSLADVVQHTLLDEQQALEALRQLEAQGEARQEGLGWRLLEPLHRGSA